MAVWYFGKPDIPLAGLVLSFGALGLPVGLTFLFPESATGYELLFWLVALIPSFLLAYYRGWKGVAIAMLVGMAVLSLVQVLVLALDIRTDWMFLFAVVAAYICIGLSVGLVSELLHQERARAERLALVDDLTDMPNRRMATLILEREFAAARRGRSLAVVVFDLDRFKEFNDRHGHAAGDEALRAFVRALRSRTRRMDLSARYGGEEFIAVLSNAGIDAGCRFADGVRDALAVEGLPEPLTVSAGVAAYDPSMESVSELVEAADEALYRAKSNGRDRVEAAASA